MTTYPLSQTIAPSGFDLRCHPLRVQALLKRKKETGKLLPSQAHGGKPSLLFGHEQEIEEMVAQYPDYTLAEYCEYWHEKTGVWLSESA
ncbi:hypothetical protein QUA53_28905, partial [Microcoleus sp. Pol12B3]